MKFLIVVDMQNDFVTGALKNDRAAAVVPFIKEQIAQARKQGTHIVYTYDTHHEDYLETMEGKKLPVPHCVINTTGWDIVDELKPAEDSVWLEEVPEGKVCNTDLKVLKNTFGYNGWSKILPEGAEVDICGTVTSICVAANASAIKALDKDIEVNVLARGCADMDDEGQAAALKVLKMQQCNIIE